ncbi:hypothetical protein [Lysinibacillus endophyticus]|nr:hypothetical protein [Lysinibacillus endophyticus]
MSVLDRTFMFVCYLLLLWFGFVFIKVGGYLFLLFISELQNI